MGVLRIRSEVMIRGVVIERSGVESGFIRRFTWHFELSLLIVVRFQVLHKRDLDVSRD
jgi:hypothetical protein